jgi:ABC-type branched-subunit amino acid transport system substrate-binding protein
MKKLFSWALALSLVAGLGLVYSVPTSLAGDRDIPEVARKSETMTAKAAVSALSQALADNSWSEEAEGWLLLYYAEALRRSGSSEARAAFEDLAEDFSNHRAKKGAILGMALVDIGSGIPNGNSRATLELMAEDGLPASMNADRFLALARAAAEEGDTTALKKYREKAEKYASISDKDTDRRVGRELSGMNEPATAAPSEVTDAITIATIRSALIRADFPTVIRESDRFLNEFASSPYAIEAGYARQRAQAGVAPERNKLVVLLPSTGSYAPAARTVKAAIELALAKEPSLSVSFLDSAGTGDGCVKQLTEAVMKQGAAMILGPMLKEEAVKCAPLAQSMHVPLLALTSWEDVIAAGDQVFRVYPSTGQLTHALLQETVVVRGLKRNAVLYPKNSYGENALEAFKADAAARGASVVTAIGYDPATVDFRKTAQSLKAQDSSLPYDAIFIPDSYQRVALLASALAYESIPVGRFRHGRVPIVLLGLNGWNNPELVRRGGNYVLDSIFIDAFDALSSDPVVADFLTAYKDKTGGVPTLVEAVAYDSLRLAARAAFSSEADLSLALKSAVVSESIVGMLRVTEDRQVERRWRILTVDGTGIVPLPVWAPPTPE